MKYMLFTLLVASLLRPSAVDAQADTVIDYLNRNVPQWMVENNVPCVGIGLIREGKVVWVKNFGELMAGTPVPVNTLFNIASQTKPVTAMLTIRLVQAGLWNLDEPLMHYWIDPDLTGDTNLPKLTTRIVLSHQTGFPNWRTDNGETRLKFLFTPGTSFRYSGEGYEYLRRALENKFHRTLEQLMMIYLLGPLDMQDTRYWSDHLDTGRMARWHNGQGKRYAISMQTPINAADDLITTVSDYCKLGIAAINGTGLSDTLYADMIRPEVRTKENYSRCLGWGRIDGLPNGEFALEHGGSDIGVRTQAFFLPKSGNGIVVMTNGDNGMFLIDEIVAHALPMSAQIKEIINDGVAKHTRITIPDSVIQRYPGTYVQSNGKELHVEQSGNAIKVFGDGAPTAVLYPESTTSFFLEGYDVQIQFPGVDSLVIFENGRQDMKIPRKKIDAAQTTVDTAALRKDLNAIASDSTEGRFTGFKGYLKAARYVEDALRSINIHTWLQAIPFIWDNYDGSSITVHGVVYRASAGDFIVLNQGKPISPGKWMVVSAGDAFKGDCPGFIELPDSNQTSDWETTAIRARRFGYMHYLPDGIPVRSGVPVILAGPYLAGNLKPGDRIRVILSHKEEYRTGYNIIGELQGTSGNDSAVVLSAHLDHIGRFGTHIYNGANDDGSGCAAELGVARMLAAHHYQWKVIFTFFCGEELNLKGSRWFVDHLPKSTMISAAINLEQLGSIHRSYPGFWALGNTAFQSAFIEAGRSIPSEPLLFSATDTVKEILQNTDSWSFMGKGIPSLLLGSGGFDEHHKPEDKVDLIDFDHLAKATEVVERLVASLRANKKG